MMDVSDTPAAGEGAADAKPSQFIVTCRLLPQGSFREIDLKINLGDRCQFSFKDDLVWIMFESDSKEWLAKTQQGLEDLRTIISTLTLQVGYPYDFEPIQWIEDKPAPNPASRNYVLGKLGAIVSRRDAPVITTEQLRKGRAYLILSEIAPHFRLAMLDYRLALSIPEEAIVFCARSLEWVEQYFDALKRSQSGLATSRKTTSRDVMIRELMIPKSHVTRFFTIANNITIARHVKDPQKVRRPTLQEQRFSIYLTRVVLDRFGTYVTLKEQGRLREHLPLPRGFDMMEEFKNANVGLADLLNLSESPT
ncbi:MAG: hypothetical protein HY666_05200 [Chloroflexi bacterium]|nr:hypothetical protein [Chloroflexota bacterium]